MMSRYCWIAATLCVQIWASGASSAEPALDRVILPDSVRFVTGFSEDRQACTMIFDNLLIGTRIGRPSLPSVETKRFVHVLGLKSDQECLVDIQVRGFVSTFGSGSASLLIHSQGASKLVDLDQAIKDAKALTVNAPNEAQRQAEELAKSEGYDSAKPDRSDDFFVCIQRKVPPNGKVQTTLLLLVDRLDESEDSGALLTVDTVDIVVKPAAK
ncbi:MAG: hypothetical protein SFV23_13065 [Planctomycetaceae bacterium]|nr:hypothetical protein [Planctomycetaceae bacterium]